MRLGGICTAIKICLVVGSEVLVKWVMSDQTSWWWEILRWNPFQRCIRWAFHRVKHLLRPCELVRVYFGLLNNWGAFVWRWCLANPIWINTRFISHNVWYCLYITLDQNDENCNCNGRRSAAKKCFCWGECVGWKCSDVCKVSNNYETNRSCEWFEWSHSGCITFERFFNVF